MGDRMQAGVDVWLDGRAGAARDDQRRRARALSRQPLGRALWLLLLSTLSVCALLLGSTANADATNYVVTGEWTFTITCSCGPSIQGTALIKQMEPTSGNYSGTVSSAEGGPGTVSGTVDGNQMSLTIINPSSPLTGGEVKFMAPTVAIEPSTNELSGSGEYNITGVSPNPTGTITAKRVRTLEQIVEDEAREKGEREGREKGEPEGRAKGEAEGRTKGETEGRAKGETEGREKGEAEGKGKAEQEVKQKAEQEAKERLAKEAQAKTEREAREKAEKEASEKAAAQGREKAEREAREKVEREAKEHQRAAKKHKKKPQKKPKHKPGKRG